MIHTTFVSPLAKIFERTDITRITLPTQDGEITILPNHEPVIAAIWAGILTVASERETERFAIAGGILETNGNHVTIAADMVDTGSDSAEDIAKKKQAALAALEAARTAGTVDIDTLIELEESVRRENARELLRTL